MCLQIEVKRGFIPGSFFHAFVSLPSSNCKVCCQYGYKSANTNNPFSFRYLKFGIKFKSSDFILFLRSMLPGPLPKPMKKIFYSKSLNFDVKLIQSLLFFCQFVAPRICQCRMTYLSVTQISRLI